MTTRKKDHKPIFISKLPRPVRPLGPGYSLPEPPPPIPKLTDPKKTPKKKVQRKLAPGLYQTFEIFRDIVKRNTEKEPETALDSRNAPDFQKLEIIEVLKDIFSRLQTEFQDLDEIRWFLTSHWKDELSERHIFRIGRGIWKFIVLHCEDVESKDGQAEEVKQEIQGSQADLPATTAEEQEADTTATNGAKELAPEIIESDPRRPAEELEWKDETTYPTGHTITKTAVILNMARNTVYSWIKRGKIERLSTGLISISEIKRVMTEKKRTENVQA